MSDLSIFIEDDTCLPLKIRWATGFVVKRLDKLLTVGQELSDRVFSDSPLQRQIHTSMLERHRLIDAGYTALEHQYRRLKLWRGSKRAAVAVVHSRLVIAYHILKDKTTYCERVSNPLDPQDRAVRTTRRARQFILVEHHSLHQSVSQRHQLLKTTCLSEQNPLCWKVVGHLTWHPQKKT